MPARSFSEDLAARGASMPTQQKETCMNPTSAFDIPLLDAPAQRSLRPGPGSPQRARRMPKALVAFAAFAALWAAAVSPASAQAFPSRPLKIIVPIAPGGGADGSMRLFAEKMQPLWKEGVIVENRGGGTGAVGLTLAKNSKPDGYTVVLATASHTALQATRTDLPYDLLKDFVAIGQMTTTSYVLLVNPANVSAKTVQEVLQLANQKPEGLTYGSAGIGSMQELCGQLLAARGRANLRHIPYTGGGPANTALLGGQIDMICATQIEARNLLKTGRVRAIAQSGLKRSDVFPDIPTVAESGLPGFQVTQFYGLLAPAGTPPDIVAFLNKNFTAVLQMPEVAKRLDDEGQQVVGSTPTQFRTFLVEQINQMRAVASQSGLPSDGKAK
jgi:tripartite-type tricarboxylate transporter receptor subunit TctC